ncbi:MAG: rRNA ((967)-C(5))-methyltransferase RsmB [Bacillota bacterium]
MIEYILVSQILNKIIHEKIQFSDALKSGLATAPKSVSQGLIRSLTSCELHHHRLLDHVTQRFIPELASEDRYVVQAAIGNNVFVKRMPHDITLAFLKDFLKERKVNESQIEAIINLAVPGRNLIDPNLKENSVPYLAIKFNTPDWLVQMWIKHFGFPITVKILSTNNKAVLQACRVNTLRISTEKLLSTYPELIPTPVEDTVIYQAKEPLKNHPAYVNNLIFQQRLAVTDIVKQFSFDNVKGEMLLVETRPQALYLELPIYTEQQIKINIVTNSVERKLAMQKSLQAFQLQNISLYEAEPKGLITHLSKPQDVVMVVPQCSKFDLIRSLPDFFIQFQQEELDTLISKQQSAIHEASQFVEEGGLLFYGVNTLNHKEGKYLIADFLTSHPAFKLIQEFQYFPFDKLNTALYVAAMRKQK